MTVVLRKDRLAEFYGLARERYAIKLRREAGMAWPWTDDPILRTYVFGNVFRSDDKTSRAIFEWAAERPGDELRVVTASRLVNKFSTIERLRAEWDLADWTAFRSIVEGNLNTSAYRLNTPRGLNSLDGIEYLLRLVWASDPWPDLLASRDLKAAVAILGRYSCLGGFVGYQMALDWLHLGFFGEGFDAEWCLAGPGAIRGARLLMGEEAQTDWDAPGYGSVTKDLPWLLSLMRQLARRAAYPENWPEGYPRWTVHEAEFMLCEYDKYKRKAAGVTSGRKYRFEKAA